MISPVSCSLLALMPSWAKLTLGTWLDVSVTSSSYAPSPCSRLLSTGNFLCLRGGFPACWDGTLAASSSALSDPVPTELRLGASDTVLGASELLSLLPPDHSNRKSHTMMCLLLVNTHWTKELLWPKVTPAAAILLPQLYAIKMHTEQPLDNPGLPSVQNVPSVTWPGLYLKWKILIFFSYILTSC